MFGELREDGFLCTRKDEKKNHGGWDAAILSGRIRLAGPPQLRDGPVAFAAINKLCMCTYQTGLFLHNWISARCE